MKGRSIRRVVAGLSHEAAPRLRRRQQRHACAAVQHGAGAIAQGKLIPDSLPEPVVKRRRGLFALAKLSYLGVRIMVGGMLQFLWVALLRGMERIMPGFPRRPAAA